MAKCFNGHRRERPGCAGCHYAHHVIEAGKVSHGVLVAPVVRGPEECPLCHEARHQTPVIGCPQCDGTFKEVVRNAMVAAEPVRSEVLGLHFLHWFVGWQARLAGWFGLVAGTTIGDLFERPDGSTNWLGLILFAAAIPLIQWGISKRIAKLEERLPRLGPKGNLEYGPDAGA